MLLKLAPTVNNEMHFMDSKAGNEIVPQSTTEYGYPFFIAKVCFRNLRRLAAFGRASGALRWPMRLGQCCGSVRRKKACTH